MSRQVIAPRIPTAAAASVGGTSRLPDDVVREQVRRLTMFGWVSGGLWAIGLLMDAVIVPSQFGMRAPAAALMIEVGGITVAAAVILYVRFAPQSQRAKADAGLWLMMLNSAAIAMLETWASDPTPATMGHLSWIAIVILLSAMMMPSTPRKMLAAALVSASMGPLGIWFAHLRGVDVPSVVTTFVMYMPSYSCAIAAVAPSYMFQRLGRSLREARELGSYELLEPLGQGGMGTVWRARHRLLARGAAIKVVRAEALGATAGEAQAQLRRFEREAQATALLKSQHSIRLFDFGATEDGSFYYVMELLHGRDLETLIKEFGPLPPERVMYLMRQVCHSLAEAHERGLVHRDVKPANIYLCRMGLEFDFVKVLDFGLVQIRSADPASAATETLATAQQLIGTPAYMAPEVILGRPDVDRRADVYALGCVAFYLLTGTRVFQEGSQMQALIDHVHTPAVPPSERIGRPLPRAVDEIVLACLKKDPADRPQDAGDVLRRIASMAAVGGWSNADARDWWHAHLPEFAGPLSALDAPERRDTADAAAGSGKSSA
jgi:serine/threonine-protein kinase